MQSTFERMYEALIDIESTMLVYGRDPFTLGELPILDFVVYKNQVTNMLNKMEADGSTGINRYS